MSYKVLVNCIDTQSISIGSFVLLGRSHWISNVRTILSPFLSHSFLVFAFTCHQNSHAFIIKKMLKYGTMNVKAWHCEATLLLNLLTVIYGFNEIERLIDVSIHFFLFVVNFVTQGLIIIYEIDCLSLYFIRKMFCSLLIEHFFSDMQSPNRRLRPHNTPI